jgi:hypothetical protein
MRNSRIKLGPAALTAVLIAAFPVSGKAETQCDAHAFGVQIDQAALALRTLNRDSEARFQERLQGIARSKGWSDAQKTEKAAEAMDDNKLGNFNSQIEELVAQLDTLSATPNSDVSCARLAELKGVRDKLVAVMSQKSGFILAQLEVEAAKAPPAAAVVAKSDPLQRVPAAPQEQVPREPASHPNPSWSVNVAQPAPALPPPPTTTQAPQRTVAAPPPLQLRPAPPRPEDKVASLPRPPANQAVPARASNATRYSVQEIRDAGQGVFGSLTSEFAVLINYAFKTYGQPNAYIVGDEGGGAFLAGLRYGDGKLYSRVNGIETGPARVYWQGPSIGADVGATGSHTLFLVYNLDDVKTLYKRFGGIDGAAYVAGGFGLTVYRSGDTLIVPIRTGLGLRLGASIAYLKFTERASLNPF